MEFRSLSSNALDEEFSWGEGGMEDEFKHHLVGWNKVCSPKQKGGLGVRLLVIRHCSANGFGVLEGRKIIFGVV